jgi:hypothetical protein
LRQKAAKTCLKLLLESQAILRWGKSNETMGRVCQRNGSVAAPG